MPDLVDGHLTERANAYGGSPDALLAAPFGLQTGLDEAAARRSLRDQIAKLERELAAVFASAYPRRGLEWRGRPPRGPPGPAPGRAEEGRGRLGAPRRGAP